MSVRQSKERLKIRGIGVKVNTFGDLQLEYMVNTDTSEELLILVLNQIKLTFVRNKKRKIDEYSVGLVSTHFIFSLFLILEKTKRSHSK